MRWMRDMIDDASRDLLAKGINIKAGRVEIAYGSTSDGQQIPSHNDEGLQQCHLSAVLVLESNLTVRVGTNVAVAELEDGFMDGPTMTALLVETMEAHAAWHE